jgi:hypothetical protein
LTSVNTLSTIIAWLDLGTPTSTLRSYPICGRSRMACAIVKRARLGTFVLLTLGP